MKLVASVLATLLVGCIVPHTHDGDDDIEPTEPTNPTNPTTPAYPIASGTYHVRTSMDLTAEALLPEPAEEVVVTLRDFSTAPARTVFDLAEDAGVPAVGTIRDALPSVLEDRLYGWIDGEIAQLSINGVSVTTLAGEIAALAETALTQFALDSELAIGKMGVPSSIDGAGNATHVMRTLDLTPAGLDATFALDDLPSSTTNAATTCAQTDASLSIGDHRFGLAYGDYAWAAIDGAMQARYRTSVRGALGAAVGCPALAQKIASKCYLGYCVGHAADLTEICERGLDEVVDRVHAKFAAMRFDAIRFTAGTARVTDTALVDGVWTAELDAGMGLRPAPATFTATR